MEYNEDMNSVSVVKNQISEEGFNVLKRELVKGISYTSFCKKILENDIYFNDLSALREALILYDFKNKIQNSTYKKYSLVVEIVFFTSLIEGYMDDGKYITIEEYLKKIVSDGEILDKKNIKKKISDYQENYSLTAKVKNFIKMGPIFDSEYLLSCLKKDDKLPKNKGLRFLSLMFNSQNYWEADFNASKYSKKVKILDQIIILCKELKKQGKISLKDIYLKTKSKKINPEEVSLLDKISKEIYQVRSNFVHAKNKDDMGIYFFNLEKREIYNFNDIDFIRFFIRTILMIHGFEINMINISSKERFIK